LQCASSWVITVHAMRALFLSRALRLAVVHTVPRAAALSNSLGPNDDAALPLLTKPSAYKRSMSGAAFSNSRSATRVCSKARS